MSAGVPRGVSAATIVLSLGVLSLGVLSLGGARQAAAAPVVERVAEVVFDYSGGTAEVHASGAADRRAPSARIAAIGAGRIARKVAARRLADALARLPAARLGCGAVPPLDVVERATAEAPASFTGFGSDGSMEYVLAVPFAALVAPAAANTAPPPVDGGAPATPTAEKAVILVDPRAQPAVLRPRAGGGCEAAPPVFETLREARARGGALHDAPVVIAKGRHPTAREAAAAKSGELPPRILAIARSDAEQRPVSKGSTK